MYGAESLSPIFLMNMKLSKWARLMQDTGPVWNLHFRYPAPRCMDSRVQGGGPGYPPTVDDQGELPTCSYHATAKALTQGKSKFLLTTETVWQWQATHLIT